jgi:multidrug efflux system membrane fusion protein
MTCLLLVAIEGCNRSNAQGGFTMPPPVVTTAPVSLQDVPVYLDEIGKTSATELVTIMPQISGKIIEKSFDDGSDLTVNQKLFQIDPRPFQAALNAALANVEQNQAQLATAKTNFDRIASLLATKAVSQQDYDTAKNNAAAADANVKAAEAQVDTARLNLEYCTISSPLDGRAGQRLVDVGNIVTANTSALLVIQKLTPIYIDFTVPENELDRVRSSMAQGALKVEARTPDDTHDAADGELTFLDNAVQDGTGTVKLRATVPNKDRRFWPGQFVHVRLILTTLKDATLIPSEALQIGQQGSYVFVVKPDQSVEQRSVTPGQRQGSLIVITQGLSADDTVVRTGQLMLSPGAHVTIANPATAPTAGANP